MTTPYRLHIYIFILILLVSFISPSASALTLCNCLDQERTTAEHLRRSFAVFTGTVTNIKRKLKPDRNEISFEVHRAWKGARHKTIKIYSSGTDLIALAREGRTCGYKFEQGQTYLIYSYRHRKKRGPSSVSKCGATKILDLENEDFIDIDELNKINKPIFTFSKEPKKEKRDVKKDHNINVMDKVLHGF